MNKKEMEIKLEMLQEIAKVFAMRNVRDINDLSRRDLNFIGDIISDKIELEVDIEYLYNTNYSIGISHHDESGDYENKIDDIYINDQNEELTLQLLNVEIQLLKDCISNEQQEENPSCCENTKLIHSDFIFCPYCGAELY